MKINDLRSFVHHKIYVAPSVLAADFANLGRSVSESLNAGADILHLDIMDGHFVPNISFGPAIVKSIRPLSTVPFDVHLMISHPSRYIQQFRDAGADHITIHIESKDNIRRVIDEIHEVGCSAGISLKPGTPPDEIEPYLDFVDLVLVMTVEPGFGGQAFQKEMTEKIRTIRRCIDTISRPVHVQVDGGIDKDSAKLTVDAGANILVAGTSVFQSPLGCKMAIEQLKSFFSET